MDIEDLEILELREALELIDRLRAILGKLVPGQTLLQLREGLSRGLERREKSALWNLKRKA